MRCSLVLLAGALGVAGVAAAPGPKAAPAGKKTEQDKEAQQFAKDLLGLTDQVARMYVRPVSQTALLDAALTGLYQAAGRTPPTDLRRRLRAAAKPAAPPDAPPGGQPLPPPPPPTPGVDPLAAPLARAFADTRGADGLRAEGALVVCARALARTLDAHSGVVTAEEQRRSLGGDGELEGLGLELAEPAGALTVESVQPGGPAQRAGLRPGDVLTAVDGKPARAADLEVLRNKRVQDDVPPPEAEGAAPAPVPPVRLVRLAYRRSGDKKDRQATLVRQRFRAETVLGVRRKSDNTWDYLLDGGRGVAHVRLAALGEATGEELRGALEGLRRAGMKGLILDLRDCPGGYLTQAVEVADLFLGRAVVATVRSRGRGDTVYRSNAVGKFRDFPMVVLVNADTSGGAELIAAALQDHGRAKVAGQRTRGKGSIQEAVALGAPGVKLKLTTGTFVRPGGQGLHRFAGAKPGAAWGVTPDEGCDCRLSPGLGAKLAEAWRLQALRPWGSKERLPLDDPDADPQRQAALALLLAPAAQAKRD